MTTELRNLPALIEKIQAKTARYVDMLVPIDTLQAAVDTAEKWDANGVSMVSRLVLQNDSGLKFGLNRLALPQLCTRIGDGGSQILPAKYVDALATLDLGAGFELARDNIKFWLDRVTKTHANDQVKQWFVRLVGDCAIPEGCDPSDSPIQFEARALLSDKFFKLDNLDIIVAMHEAIKGLTEDETEHRASAGVEVVNWRLSDTKMDIMLVNPNMAFDLHNPDGGIITKGLKHTTTGGHQFMRVSTGDPGQHLVYPAARMTNSETGHGGMQIQSGLYEGICANGCMIGKNVVRRHIGKVMEDTSHSLETAEKKREVIRCEIRDHVGLVFSESAFRDHCKAFAATFGIEIEGGKVKEVVAQVVAATKLPQSTIDDILTAYSPLVQGKDTLGDVQRAVTHVAHTSSQDLARDLQDAGGRILTMTPRRQEALCAV